MSRLVAWGMCLVLGLLLLLKEAPLSFSQPASTSRDTDRVIRVQIDDAVISPVTADYIAGGLEQAEEQGAEALLIELDTPGGMLASTHTILRSILNAPVPVIVYVAPAGARAGSAGVFITMAAHVAAMAPASHIGAAHPVDASGNWPSPEPSESEEDNRQLNPPPGREVMSEKILNDTIATMRVLARTRGRNEAWAVRAITESASIPAEEALKERVIDIIAPDLPALFQAANGRTVALANRTVTLDLDQPDVVDFELSVTQQLLSILAHPMISTLLLMLGFYGLLFEITHPGFGAPGIIGAVLLILGLIGIQLIPINALGLVLMGLGGVLFIAELFTPTFGLLFAGGVVCLVAGVLVLGQTGDPYLASVLPYLLGLAVVMIAMTGTLLWKIQKTRRRKALGPMDILIGQTGTVTQAIAPHCPGKVWVYGEIWDAETESQSLALQQPIRVTGLHPTLRNRLIVSSLDLKDDLTEESPPCPGS